VTAKTDLFQPPDQATRAVPPRHSQAPLTTCPRTGTDTKTEAPQFANDKEHVAENESGRFGNKNDGFTNESDGFEKQNSRADEFNGPERANADETGDHGNENADETGDHGNENANEHENERERTA
jgi:hypothetical protein